MSESPDYLQKKSHFDRMLTVYGRKAVLETLRDASLDCQTLHLADSNREAGIVSDIKTLAQSRGATLRLHSRAELSRLSKNGKQDQGVALDVLCPAFSSLEEFLTRTDAVPQGRLLALDGISNPQNLGMIIRSAAAGAIDGLIIAQKGNAALGPLVIKASAGTVFRAPILRCNALPEALKHCKEHGAQICTLEAGATTSLFDHRGPGFCVYVLGNETQGVGEGAAALADERLSIPMRNSVESLNVAVTASLIAFGSYLER